MSLFLLAGLSCSAATIERIVFAQKKGQSKKYPSISSSENVFFSTQQTAIKGNTDAQVELYTLVSEHFKKVYSIVSTTDSLLFSLRKVKRDFFDEASNNYAINIETFLKKTTDKVKIKKRNFRVQTSAGEEWLVGEIKYQPETGEIEVKKPKTAITKKIKFAELTEENQRFIKIARVNNLFKSKLSITCEDQKQDEIKKIKARYTITTFDGMSRTLIIKNKSDTAIDNLLVEYQSFAEQTLLGYSKDLPEEYRTIGYFKIDSLAPGQQIEHPLTLPHVSRTITQTTQSGNTEYYIKYPPNTHKSGDGKICGVWVKVHRITPMGERVEKEFKSSGLRSKKWLAVAPLSAQFD